MARLTNGIRILATLSLALAASHASAHVGYGSSLYTGAGAYDPLANVIGTGTYGAASNFTPSVSSNAGFLTGLDPATLGDTHNIRFRYFVLSQPSTVSFSINGLPNLPVSGNTNPYLNGLTASTLNPAFSMYSGVVPGSSHEGVGDIDPNVSTYPAVATYLATAPDFAPWSPFADVNHLRGGTAAGTPGNPIGLWGVFDTNGGWTTGNNGQFTDTSTSFTDPAPADGIGPYLGNQGVPKIGTVHWLGIARADAATGATFTDSEGNAQAVLGADGTVDNMVSWSGVLGPGIYTLAIGGANLLNYADLFAHVRSSLAGHDTTTMCGSTTCANLYAADRLSRSLSITGFTVTVVPVPAVGWLFGVALLGVAARTARRRQRA
jgi:hypothetical protein